MISVKQLAKYDRYLKILEVCKGKELSCEIIGDLVYIGFKSSLLDCRILSQFGYLKESQLRISRLGRKTKHYTTVIDTLDQDTFKSMTEKTASYWSKAKRFRPELYKTKKSKDAGTIPEVDLGNFAPLYQLLGLNTKADIKPLPKELITVYDINQNKDKVNDTIKYDVKKSPRAYPGTSAGMVW